MVDGGLRWWVQDTPLGPLTVVMHDDRLVDVTLDPDAIDPPMPGPRARAGESVRAEPDRSMEVDRDVAAQFDEYFAGTRRRFDVPIGLDPGLTPFRRRVYETLHREVPYGETVSYGELAAMSGRPGAARAVGSTMRDNRLLIVVPCHRVITGSGHLGGFGGCPDRKRVLLALEGGPVPPD